MSSNSAVTSSFAFGAFASEALQPIAMELMIFGATIAIALVLKFIAYRNGGGCSAGLQPFGNTRQTASKAKSEDYPVAKGNANARAQQNVGQQSAGRNATTSTQGVARVLDQIVAKAANQKEAEALSLYADMRANHLHLQVKELARASAHHSVLDVYSALVQCAVRVGRPQLVEQLMDDLASARVERTLSFYESAMKVLASKKHYKEALAVYNRLDAEGLKASPVTLSCLINFTAELGDFDRAIAFFEQLSVVSTPSIRAYMTALRVHSKRLDWRKSMEIFRSMQARSVPMDSLILNIVLATGVAAGRNELAEAEALLHEQAVDNPGIVDVISYNTLLKGYANQTSAPKAVQLLSQMLDRAVKPNGISFNTVMDAAVRGSQVQDAWDVLEQMQGMGIKADKYTCTILMKGLTKDSTPKQFSKVLDVLLVAMPQCDASQRSTLMRGLVQVASKLNNSALLMRAFLAMQAQHVVVEPSEFQLMIKSLASESNTSGCSSVWRHVLGFGSQQAVSMVSAETIFKDVVGELSRKGQIDGVICTFESLRSAVMGDAPGMPDTDKHATGSTEKLLHRCRDILCQITQG